MSNYYADQPMRRSRRQPKKSLRQRESEGDGTIEPAIDSARTTPGPPDADASDSETKRREDEVDKIMRLPKRHSVMIAEKMAKDDPAPRTPERLDNAKITTKATRVTKMRPAVGAPPSYPKPKRKYQKKVKIVEPKHIQEEELHESEYPTPYNLPSFTYQTFMIYPWPYHRPHNILDLSPSLKKWKDKQDEADANIDNDDGSDDWDDFSGNLYHYPSEAALHTAVARTFVNRAKRAFRAHKSWSDFVIEESLADPSRSASREQNPQKRNRALKDVLNNDLRMAILDKVAARLCTEIWLEEYSAETTGRLRSDRFPNGISPAQMSTADLQADLKQIDRLQYENQHRAKGGNIGMTGLEAVLWARALNASSDEEGM